MLTQEGYLPIKAGLRLHYHVLGDSGNPVIIPGAYGLIEDLNLIAEECRAIFYDQRGRGQSDCDPDTTSLGRDYEVSDIETVRQSFDFEKVGLFGWSYLGGAVARYAAQHPQRVSRMIMMCPISLRNPAPYDDPQAEQKEQSRIDPNELEKLQKMIASEEYLRNPEGFCREFKRILTPRQMGKPEALQRMRSDPCIYPNEWWHNIREHNQLHFPPETRVNYDWREQVAGASAPTLVIHGTEDLIPVESSKEWCSTLPNARLLIIEGVGHYPHLEAPDTFFPAVVKFLKGEWPNEAMVIT